MFLFCFGFLVSFCSLINGQIVSECSFNDDIEYIYFSDVVDANQALELCTQLSPSTTLAQIPSASAFNLLASFLLQNTESDQPWIGLRRKPDEQFPQGTDFTDPGFFFSDADEFGNVQNGVFPWREGRPNNQMNGNSACVM